jgi:PilZ domain
MSAQIAECRVYERHSCQVTTSCQPAGAADELRWDGTIADLSRTGVRLRLRRRFEPRTGLAIELPGKEEQEPYTVYVKVIRVHDDGDGFYSLGCRLVGELSEDELQRLLTLAELVPDEFIVPDSEELESDDAVDLGAVPAGITVPNVRLWIGVREGYFAHCRVKRFHVPGRWPLAPGKVLNLRGVSADGVRLEHQFQVIDCRPHGATWLVQVRPIDPASVPGWVHTLERPEHA